MSTPARLARSLIGECPKMFHYLCLVYMYTEELFYLYLQVVLTKCSHLGTLCLWIEVESNCSRKVLRDS